MDNVPWGWKPRGKCHLERIISAAVCLIRVLQDPALRHSMLFVSPHDVIHRTMVAACAAAVPPQGGSGLSSAWRVFGRSVAYAQRGGAGDLTESSRQGTW